MSEIATLTLASGEQIGIEVEEVPRRQGERLVSAGADPAGSVAFEQAIGRIKPLANDLLTALTDLAQKPDSVSVKFGVKVNAAAGVVIARTGAEAHFEIALSWSGKS